MVRLHLFAEGQTEQTFANTVYSAKQVQKGRPRQGQVPERGVVEVKSASDDPWLTADSHQASRYRRRYRLVLVTKTRDFVPKWAADRRCWIAWFGDLGH